MALPVRHLPVLQNWDCNGCTNCCREYRVPVSDEERQRIMAQGWDKDPDLGDFPLFLPVGPWWHRRYRLSEIGDHCIFLNEQGRCRIHEKFGAEAKPLACRLFPFVLVAAGDHWRVGLRYACPSAAANKGRVLEEHDSELSRYVAALEQRDGIEKAKLPPLPLQKGQQVDWPDLLRFVQALLALLRDRRDRVERRWRKCLTLAQLCRQARFEQIKGSRLVEFLNLVTSGLESDVPAAPSSVPAPTWVGRILFRLTLAIYLRRDHGPERGPAMRNRLSLSRAALAFARGSGMVPRVNRRLPETTFEQVEETLVPLGNAAEEVLERYYVTKVGSLQFCGPTNFGMGLWEGLESLALTVPLILWLTRAHVGVPQEEAVVRSLGVVDDHFGFNPLLGSYRQRFGLSILTRLGELPKLIAWYGR